MAMYISVMVVCDVCHQRFGTEAELHPGSEETPDSFTVKEVSPWNFAFAGRQTCSNKCRHKLRGTVWPKP
jgi:hypothetical protein